MTHDELLAEIDERTSYLGNIDGVYTALRAVVELHKADEPDDYGTIGCLACGYDSEYGQYLQAFPCPTRQAIEKELK